MTTRPAGAAAPAGRTEDLLHFLREALQSYVTCQDLAAASDCLLQGMLRHTDSAYGFIGEVLRGEDGVPYFKSHAISDIAWDDGSRALYDRARAGNLEFRNLNTLFGAVLTSGAPVIANDPEHDPRRGGLPEGHPPLTAFLGLPIRYEGELIGIAGLANRPGGYDETITEFLDILASTYASLLEAARLRRVQQRVVDELEKARDAAQQAHQTRDAFLAAWGHDLRTPLNAMLGHAQLLAMNPDLDPETREQVSEIEKGARDFARLVTELLERLHDVDGRSAEPETPRLVPPVVDPAAEAISEPSPPERILVAEDDPASQAILRMQLRVLGREADIAPDGLSALALWDQHRHGVALIDRHMPGMDGLTLARTIRERETGGGRALLLATTASADPEDHALCLRSGMDGILSKPIELAALRAALGLEAAPTQAGGIAPASAVDPRQESVLDPKALRRAAGDLTQDQARELINLFIASARRELREASRRLGAGEREAVGLIMHKLKSSAGAVGASRFSVRALHLEQAARDDAVDDLGPLLAGLDLDLEAVEAAVRQSFGAAGPSNSMSGAEDLPPLGSDLPPTGQGFSADDLQRALEQDEFLVHFQPKLALGQGKVAGIEALARWRRGGGTLPAQRFIDAVQRHGLIQPLSELLAAKALLAVNELERTGFRLPLSLNLAASWLDNPRLPDFLLATRRAVGAEGGSVVVEVDLADLPEDPANAPATLARLRGQGYILSLCHPCAVSSLAALAARLPRYMAGELKLGHTLLRQADQDPTVRARLGALLSAARAGGLTLVAEGVESQADLDLARSLGCDQAQGWFIAGAMPLEQLLAWLRGRGPD